MSSVYLLATLDTKGKEIEYVRDRLVTIGIATTIVDTGCLSEPTVRPDISRQEVFQASGTTLEEARSRNDRGWAVSQAARGATNIVLQGIEEGHVAGLLGIGGSAGTTIASSAMRALPLGVPKVMLSTLASGDVRAFVGAKDVVMINSVVDILGLNRISRVVLDEAAHAMAGLVKFGSAARQSDDKPLIAATMFGVTTPCVEQAQKVLEENGFEVIVFHATGTGGQAMESLIRDGMITGVLDLTTTEIADELLGGVLSAGPERLAAAAEMGIPQIVSVGATDMVNFWAIDTVPNEFRQRQLYKHNDNVTLMRTTVDECRQIGEEIGDKVGKSTGPVAILLPGHGVSAIDREGQPFDDREARLALFTAIRDKVGSMEVIELPNHINDRSFAEYAANKLIQLIKSRHANTEP